MCVCVCIYISVDVWMHMCTYTKLCKYISSCTDNFESLKKAIGA